MIEFTEEEKACVEAIAQRIVVWVINNQRDNISMKLLTDEMAIAVSNRVIEINQGAPFKVEINPDSWHGIWGTKG